MPKELSPCCAPRLSRYRRTKLVTVPQRCFSLPLFGYGDRTLRPSSGAPNETSSHPEENRKTPTSPYMEIGTRRFSKVKEIVPISKCCPSSQARPYSVRGGISRSEAIFGELLPFRNSYFLAIRTARLKRLWQRISLSGEGSTVIRLNLRARNHHEWD